MTKVFYVYSTMTGGVTYTQYIKTANDIPEIGKRVAIKGGSNVHRPGTLHTPRGTVTKVTEEDMEFLLTDELFKTHVKNGYVTFDSIEVDPEVQVGKGMEQRDGSAPLVPEDFGPGGIDGPKPVTAEGKSKFLDKLMGKTGG
jgi:hypothetical protein